LGQTAKHAEQSVIIEIQVDLANRLFGKGRGWINLGSSKVCYLVHNFAPKNASNIPQKNPTLGLYGLGALYWGITSQLIQIAAGKWVEISSVSSTQA